MSAVTPTGATETVDGRYAGLDTWDDGDILLALLSGHRQWPDLGHAGQLVAQRFGQVGHGAELGGASLMDPAKKLGSAKPLFSQFFAERGQTFKVVIEQVGRHASA